jgi:hypothetical protein
MAMTTDEAIQINAELLRRAKGRKGNPNWEEWYGVRCAVCAHYVQEGEQYLNWIPAMYKDRARADTKIMHASCLVLGDGSSYNYSKKEAVYKGGGPLLTNDLIYDIINGKETDDSD